MFDPIICWRIKKKVPASADNIADQDWRQRAAVISVFDLLIKCNIRKAAIRIAILQTFPEK